MLRFLLFLALAFQASAQDTMIREVFDTGTDTHVEVLALFTKPSPGGYFPVRVKIANNLKSDRSIRLDFTSSQNYDDRLQTKSSFDFSAGAGKTVVRDIVVPLSPPNGYYANNQIEVRMSGSLGDAENSIYAELGPDQPAVLLSEALFTPNASALDAEILKKIGSSHRGSSEFSSKFDPKQLPDDWLAFSGYDSVIMTDGDWTKVPPGAKNAILAWVRLGGQLIVYSNSPVVRASLGLPAETGYGSLLLETVSSGFPKLDETEVIEHVTDNLVKPRQTSLRNDFRGSWPLQIHFGSQAFRYGLFIVVLVIFGILVGPVNLFVFAKSGQRHRLFITTPLISLGASLVLIILIIAQDGFGGRGMRRVLMEVRPDGDLNAAYVHQEQFCRTGVMTGSRFTLETPVAIQPVAIAGSRWARFTDGPGAKGNLNLQPADGKILASGDWFQSRSEHGHTLSAVVSTRGRIETAGSPGSYLSTFDFPLETLYFMDAGKQWHRAENITTGKRFTMTPVDETMVLPALTKEANAFSHRNNQFLELAKNRPGHFVAITSQAPGIATNPGIRWTETRSVITGPVVVP
ncbi:hypothetical protein JIN84_16960 [Luteolibacter yonseiensis]|uniref:Uncharacterized protein n=1 Tax=Luteolibacter yonseiensis TaxID=1144680 RepID=A0A934VBI7_9BACT|nr:hypothetical protein [Luteolibacter yonseiensis]MBK1817313.1 hypothetical protein [Luteolibacter yonseiensis]